MREEYERDLHHAWMILETDELYKEDYQMRMLMENAIPGLLSVRGQGKDDKSQYRYEISGKISVKAKGEKEHWKFADLENFMRQFIQVLYAVKNYLLDVNCLSLDPGHIYVSDEIYYFCYCPGVEGNILEKFHELTYQMRMLMENAIPGLLSVRGQGKDDKSQYRYEISGKISVKAKGEKEHWKFADLENFMRQFIQVLYAVKNYLLDVNCLSLDPGHIYVSDEIYYFCYCPGVEGNILEKFHELTEYFVRETDYEQKEAVYLAYELHKASMEENYNIEYALERILEKKENEMESIQPEKKVGYDLQEELILDDWIAEQEMKGQVVKDRQSVWGFLNQRLQKRRKKRESQWDEIMADDSEE